jgi:hypothetical protein
VGLAGVVEAVWEVLMEWGVRTRWLSSRLAYDGPRGCRVRVGGESKLEVGVLVVERNFAEFSGEFARDHFGKRHEPSAWVLTVKIRHPSHEFTFGVGITFVSYSLVLTPVV